MKTNKIRVAVIGCTKSTERLIAELLEISEVDLIGVITLDPSLGHEKSRYVLIKNKNFKKGFDIALVGSSYESSLEHLVRSWNLDVLVEIGWSKKIPASLLAFPKYGTVGIHNSMLPAYQGGASLNWALIGGYRSWGCTLFYLESTFDTGDIIFQEKFNISDQDDINTLFKKSDDLAVKMISRFLPLAVENLAPRVPQNPKRKSRTPKRSPKDGIINWSISNKSIFNLIRALKHPYPRAFSFLAGKKVLINAAELTTGKKATPGTVTDIRPNGYVVSTAQGSILITEINYEDGKLCNPNLGDCFDA